MPAEPSQARVLPARRENFNDANITVTQNLTAIFKTTCGAAFRCNKLSAGDVERLFCHQCLNQQRHIMEGRPSTDLELTDRGIIYVNSAEQTANAESFMVDLKCARRTDPISAASATENNELTHLSQTLDVTCATKILSGQNETECGHWLKLSELPEHYLCDHRRLPAVATLSSAQIEEICEQSGVGTFFWAIGDWRERFKDAVDGKSTSFYSPDFYSTQGYRLCLRFYPNGDGIGKGESASLFLVVMKGENDDRLEWPFQQMINFDVMGEGGRVLFDDGFRSHPNSSSFAKPVTIMNHACGIPRFFPLHSVAKMLVKDHLFIRVRVGDEPAEPPSCDPLRFAIGLCFPTAKAL